MSGAQDPIIPYGGGQLLQHFHFARRHHSQTAAAGTKFTWRRSASPLCRSI